VVKIATAITILGAAFGALLVNIPSERLGRRPVLLFNNVLYLLGAAMCAFAPQVTPRTRTRTRTGAHRILQQYGMLIVGRLVVGVGIGVASVIVPQLIAEVSEGLRLQLYRA